MVIWRVPGRWCAAVGARRDRRARVRGDEAADRIAERDPALLDQHEDGGAGDRLGLRRDAEHRVGGHRAARLAVDPPDALLIGDLSVAQHQRDRAADAIGVDVLLQKTIDAREPLGEKPFGARAIGAREGWAASGDASATSAATATDARARREKRVGGGGNACDIDSAAR
jgi:hypothetical protein